MEQAKLSEQQQQVQMVLQALNLQRAQAVRTLSDKAQTLLDSDKLTIEHLGNPAIVGTLRDAVGGITAAASALTAHDKLMSMLIQDLGACATNLSNMMGGLVSTSMALEAVMTTLVSKGVITEEEVVQAHKDMMAAAQKNESNVVPLLGPDGQPVGKSPV